MLRGSNAPRRAVAVGFATSLLFLLQLRIADGSRTARKTHGGGHRPVPRGLVTLRELAIVFALAAAAQFALALGGPRACSIAWLRLALPCAHEPRFFVRRSWLEARPFTYMWTHMMILPLVDLYATGHAIGARTARARRAAFGGFSRSVF